MIVADASVILAWLLRPGSIPVPPEEHSRSASDRYRDRQRSARTCSPGRPGRTRRVGITRHGTFAMLDRVWELRHHLSAHDAAYVALAEGLRCRLVTGDASDQSSAWAALPGDSVARLTESWPQMLTKLGLFKQISPHCAKFLINHADRGFDDNGCVILCMASADSGFM